MPGTRTATSRTVTAIRATGDQRRSSPTGSRTATTSATSPRAAKTSWSSPGRHAGSSLSAASIADAEKTMTSPMASSRPAAPMTRWQLVIGPSIQAGRGSPGRVPGSADRDGARPGVRRVPPRDAAVRLSIPPS